MFIFGHVGIGRRLASPWRARLPAIALVVGMLLPDLIDKPLYYSRLFPFVTATRTFGHTGLLLLLLVGFAYGRRSTTAAALSVGVATHLLLDLLNELPTPKGAKALLVMFGWPLTGAHFPANYVPSVATHLETLWVWPVIAGEGVGMLLLGWELWRWYTRRSSGRPA